MNTLQDVVDTICIVYFTLEYIVRFMCAPKKLRFIMQPMNQAGLGLSELNSSTPKATTENIGYTDSGGDCQKCHCSRLSHNPIIFSI